MGVLWKHGSCLAAPARHRVQYKSTLFLAFTALTGFTAVLQSGAVLDSRNGDYPPWSFHRQEMVWAQRKREKTSPGLCHLRTDRRCISMNRASLSFGASNLTWEKRRISAGWCCAFWSRSTHISEKATSVDSKRREKERLVRCWRKQPFNEGPTIEKISDLLAYFTNQQ